MDWTQYIRSYYKNLYMFPHRGAIIWGPYITKECRPNTPV
jgi:hypothetical protein